MDQIKEGFRMNSSSSDDYGLDSYSGGIDLFSCLNGANFNFTQTGYHVFFERTDNNVEIHRLGIPLNFSIEQFDIDAWEDGIKVKGNKG
tara:strand:+ start:75 stop:341 length:267 start_codon:yes stop_codon:yes gene_type:complete